jgi:hypothetical protein
MIIWLASYPKSGNTWLRSILSAYYFSKDGEFEFNLLDNIKQFPHEVFFEDDKNFYSEPESTSRNWIKKQIEINKDRKIKLFKTHNALCSINGNNFTDTANTLGAIYIIRDPRKIISSISNHYQISINEAYEFMNNNRKALSTKKNNQYPGFVPLFSWSIHLEGWINCKLFPVMTIKYEDLQHETFFTIKKVINFINKISKSKNLFNRDKAKNSIESCQFDRLKKMEQKQGFQESMIKNDNSGSVNFFNLGQKNDYKKLLDKKLIKTLNELYKNELKKFNYEI